MNVERVRELARVLREEATPKTFDWANCEKCVAAWCSRVFGIPREGPLTLARALDLEPTEANDLYVSWPEEHGRLFGLSRQPKLAAEKLEKMADEYERRTL